MSEGSAEIARLEASVAAGSAALADVERLAALKLEAGDANGAISAYQHCLSAAAPQAGLYNNLGLALMRAGRLDEAISALQSALTMRPGYARAQVNLGKALFESGRIDESLAQLHAALAGQPHYVPALVNLGAALGAAGALREAAEALEKALRIEPDHIEARATLAMVQLWSGQTDSAVLALRETLSLAPQHADAHANLAHALFASGDWAAAWPHFEFRFRRAAQRAALKVPAPLQRWDGTIRPDRDLWLIGEQGLGDQLQFARYAKVLAAAGQRCVISCEPCLVKLLSSSGLDAEVRAHGASPESPDGTWMPLMSAPGWHGTTRITVPEAGAYLAAEPSRVARWRARIPQSGLRVGLVWAGNPRMETGLYAGRSPPWAALEPLFGAPGIEFIALQKNPGRAPLDVPPFAARIRRFDDLDAGADAFVDSAAVLKCVDLLITCDTAIAHLGGALGVPTWLTLMKEPDWRWMRDGKSTPWYRSVRLFRQAARGDWPGVYREVADELRRLTC